MKIILKAIKFCAFILNVQVRKVHFKRNLYEIFNNNDKNYSFCAVESKVYLNKRQLSQNWRISFDSCERSFSAMRRIKTRLRTEFKKLQLKYKN